MSEKVWDVLDFGAVSDGSVLCTAAIQSAIDAANAAGGGRVIVPAGRYLTGAVNLCDNLIFEMLPGAELHASSDPADYPPSVGSFRSSYRNPDGSQPEGLLSALVCGRNVKNVTVRGGRLTAEPHAYLERKCPEGSEFEPVYEAQAWHYYKQRRPRISMILMEDCEKVTVENLEIAEYPAYAGWFLGCSRVFIRYIETFADQSGINTDGFHFSSCRWVSITDSHFFCGDYCIAIDSNHCGDSTDFTVNGCIFNTSVHAFRIYTGIDPNFTKIDHMGEVKRVTISGCTVEDAAGLLSLSGCDGHVSDVTLSGITANLDREGTAISLATRNGTIRNLHFEGLNLRSNGTMCISAEKKGDIKGITLCSSSFTVTPKTKLDAAPGRFASQSFPDHCHFRPSHFCFVRAEDVTLRDVLLRWEAPVYSESWPEERREAVAAVLKERFGLTLSELEPRELSAVECVDCEGIRLEDNVLPEFAM